MSARDELTAELGADVALVKSGGGVFEITVDDRLVFSKKALGRFPEPGELRGLAAGRIAAGSGVEVPESERCRIACCRPAQEIEDSTGTVTGEAEACLSRHASRLDDPQRIPGRAMK